MKSPEIMFLWGDGQERRSLYKVLASTGATVGHAESLAPGVLLDQCKLVVLDYDALRSTATTVMRHLSSLESPPPVLVVTSSRDKTDLIELFSHNALTNLVAKNDDLLADELIVTVQKIINNDIFGIEKYLTWGVHTFEYVIASSEGRQAPMNALRSYLESLGANRRLIGLAESVADELIMNAVYNAPADDAGRPKYASRSRTEQVSLAPPEHVRFTFGSDGRYLALCVSDRFGRLATETVRQYLRKCFVGGEGQIDAKQGGAGLGLYVIFQSLNQFIINVAPGRQTEMIGLLDISGSFRDFAQQAKSLHLFLHRENGR
jgi:hypothetical protein